MEKCPFYRGVRLRIVRLIEVFSVRNTPKICRDMWKYPSQRGVRLMGCQEVSLYICQNQSAVTVWLNIDVQIRSSYLSECICPNLTAKSVRLQLSKPGGNFHRNVFVDLSEYVYHIFYKFWQIYSFLRIDRECSDFLKKSLFQVNQSCQDRQLVLRVRATRRGYKTLAIS